MKGPRGTELAMPFHPLYTPWGPSPGGTDRTMAHRIVRWEVLLSRCDNAVFFPLMVFIKSSKLVWNRGPMPGFYE